MLEFLCSVADDCWWDRSTYGLRTIVRPDNWLASAESLIKRGLIVRLSQDLIDERSKKEQLKPEEDRYRFSPYVLTPAGEKVVELLKISGLFIEQDAAIERKHKRKA